METFYDVVTGNQLILVDFFATWCQPCKMMHPILKQVKDVRATASVSSRLMWTHTAYCLRNTRFSPSLPSCCSATGKYSGEPAA